MKIIALIFFIASLPAIATDTIPLPKDGWKTNFDQFEGTHASLPNGIAVSKDGATEMTADDSDFRGIDDGNVTSGGCYAWGLDANDHALGYQPTTDEFTPGWFQAVFSNSAAVTYRFLKIQYDAVCLNNENRSSKLELHILTSSGLTVSPADMTFESGKSESVPATWTKTRLTCCIKLPEPVKSGETFTIRWQGNDNGGNGSRDEYGIDNIEVKGIESRGTLITIR